MATTLTLGAALAHAYELMVKMGLSGADYFTVQSIYSGWNQIAYVLAVELAAILAIIFLYRQQSNILWPAIVALASFLVSQAIFWIWTYPANVATDQWTRQPENWETLRRNWEYSHLAGAAFQLVAMAALVFAVLQRGHNARQNAPGNNWPRG
jgi:hypothetical protein